MTVADSYLKELGSAGDGWTRDEALAMAKAESEDADSAAVAHARRLRAASEPVLVFMVEFAAGKRPGIDAGEDARWLASTALARREVRINQEVGVDEGLAGLDLLVLDWIEAQIDETGDRGFSARVRDEIDGRLDAGRRGRQRGAQLRAARERAGEPDPVSPYATLAGFLLCHPNDHYLRSARAAMRDHPLLCEILDAQIAIMQMSYDRLTAESEPAQAAFVAELRVEAEPRGWRWPVATTVVAAAVGAVGVGDRVGLRLVADPQAPFNGTLVSVRAGERWLICGDALQDGTVVPGDATRRIAA